LRAAEEGMTRTIKMTITIKITTNFEQPS